MTTAFRFSILVFAPLLIAFLLPAMFLLPSGILMTLIGIWDPTISAPEVTGYTVWVCSPLVAAAGLLLSGMWLHSFYLRGRSRKAGWVVIWAVSSVALFVAAWFGVTILTSIGASDYSVSRFLRWTASVAALLTLAFQPGMGLWLLVSSRILYRLGTRNAAAAHR